MAHPDEMSFQNACEWVLAQLAGGGAGAVLYMLILIGIDGVDNTFPVQNQDGYSVKQACVSEFFGTFILAYVVLCVATTRKALTEYFGFAIGACIVAGGSAMGRISGGLLNPTVAIGAAAVNLDIIHHLWLVIMFVAAQLLGGAAAAVVFKNLTHVSEFEAGARGKPVHGVDSAPVIMVA
eukprot:TRINITY_DN19926_c0_g2_i1.p1 TRINITY_DN19926_c0_g2~~TRINITY_DN19926_c0_g2_i1.p1  ORF type:complete len:192 (+),score=40.96 TRINITY_DN19926_c0_g2_i1:38-577(+)